MFQWKNREAIHPPEAKPYEWGYVWGTAISDGSVYRRLNKEYMRLAVTDYEFAQLFRDCVSRITEVTYKILGPYGKNYVVLATCPPLVERLTMLIATDKYNWEVPAEAFLDSELARGFLNAYLDGDGSVSKDSRGNPRISWTSVNQSGLEQVYELLNRLGIHATLFPIHTQNAHGLTISRRNDIIKYHSDIGITLTRKQDRLNALIEGL